MGKTVFEKIWDQHVVVERDDGNVLLYIDRHLTHDLHFRALHALKANGQTLKEPDKLFGVPDHSVTTTAKTVA
ncbi:MAG: aconitase family protein, partial [Alphaproteobacteria bacterium]